MKKFLSFIIFIITISCSNDEENTTSVKIRISNVSPFNFQDIIVNTGSSNGNVNFGNLEAGEKTVYKEFDSAYAYAFIELEIEGKIYTLQPIDYVGETPLEDGNYTYQIKASDSENQYQKLSLTLIRE
ncbi:hypothetical protein [Flavobacterium adhaerens]|uniref:hypothetical protein n=1 Tax=Flavobacterium adhaerens TaxID=3149043 RepID=UPI0032B494F8